LSSYIEYYMLIISLLKLQIHQTATPDNIVITIDFHVQFTQNIQGDSPSMLTPPFFFNYAVIQNQVFYTT